MSRDGHPQEFDNVCLTGGVVIAAFCTGLALVAVISIHAFWLH